MRCLKGGGSFHQSQLLMPPITKPCDVLLYEWPAIGRDTRSRMIRIRSEIQLPYAWDSKLDAASTFYKLLSGESVSSLSVQNNVLLDTPLFGRVLSCKWLRHATSFDPPFDSHTVTFIVLLARFYRRGL